MSTVYLIAGEPSGDILGARLMSALRQLGPEDPAFLGVGGTEMTASGFESLFPMHELSVMGLAEVVPRIPALLRRIKQTADDIRAKKPDVVVTIDAPDFCFRVAKRLKGSGIPIVHYVAPSVWAWRPGRADKVARLVDHVMCLLPFEPPYFERAGVDATFVGHSILESAADSGDGGAFRERHGITPDARVLAVLPGSRMGEVGRLLDVFGETVSRVSEALPGLEIVIPTVDTVADAIRSGTRDWPNTRVVEGEAEKYDAFAAADASLAASGTVTVELAMARVPTIVGYRVQPLTAAVGRRLLKIKYVSIVNLVLDAPVMPEFLQEACTPANLGPAVIEKLGNPGAASADIERALAQLKAGEDAPSMAAAKVVAQVVSAKKNAEP